VIEIAGKEVGRGSQFEIDLAAGEYPMVVRHAGYESWTKTVTVVAGEKQTISIALDHTKVAVAEPAPVPTPSEPEPIEIEPEPSTDTKPAKSGTTPTRPVRRGDRKPPRVADKPDPQPKVEPVDPPRADPPKADPPRVEPPKVEPPKVEPPKEPDKPARTPVVAASSVTKLSGEVPVLRTSSGDSNGDVLVKMCIDEQGKVSSVKVVKSTAEIASELERALKSWRYKPYLNKDQKPSPVCFPLPLRLVIKGN
jgi:hypothetical protein